ncbi:MAG: hypothetical protein AABW85_02455 [archaeon]
MKFLVPVLCLVLIAGCVANVPPAGNQQQDQNFSGGAVDSNSVLGTNGALGSGSNSISLDLDANRIVFNFNVDLNSPNLDRNVLASACNSSCNVIDANTWKVTKDLNFGVFFCTCTKTICYGRKETATQIINYCRDDSVALWFMEKPKE